MRNLLLALALSGSLAAGRPPLVDQLWPLLTSVWSASTTDAECGADPDGRCRPAPQTDAGCIGDPNGGPCGS